MNTYLRVCLGVSEVPVTITIIAPLAPTQGGYAACKKAEVAGVPQDKSHELKSFCINFTLTQANASRQDGDTFENLRASL